MSQVKRVARWGGVVLVMLLVLAGIGAGVVYYLISRLDIRAEISNAVEQSTGRKLTIAGRVGVSVWPVLGLEAHDASLANAQGGRAAALVQMDALHVGVEIAPLFRREVVVRELAFDHPRIALEIGRDGAPNWRMQPIGPAPSSQIARQAQDIATSSEFSLRQIRIRDGEVTFFDARRNAGWTLDSADLRAALISMDKPFTVSGVVSYLSHPVTMRLELQSPRLAMTGRAAPMKFSIASELLDAEFDGTSSAATGEIMGQVRASGPSLRRLSAWAGAPIVGGAGMERFAVSGTLGVQNGAYSFSNAGFSLDDARGRGDFVLTQRHGKPYVSGRLEMFDFDFNPYLTGAASAIAPPPDAGAPAGAAGAAPAPIAAPRSLDITQEAGHAAIDFGGLKAVNADLELTTHKMLFQHMRIDHSVLGLVVNDGYLAATLHQLDLYGGSARGRIEVDAREADVRLSQDMTFSGVDANALLSDALHFENLEGKAEVTYSLRTHGRSQSDLINDADGRIHVEVITGALRGVDMGGLARTLRNALNNELISPQARTPFTGMSATFAIADGVLASNNLSFNTPELSIPGIAVIDLRARRIDARMAPRSSRGGIVIPFAARGSFDDIRYASDISDRARREIDARVRQVQAAAR
ncbi:MAG TPA: AsmA family protein [Caulobacterales bacterium]|nr:AsmA family protein [Caulobacterales bacterium]